MDKAILKTIILEQEEDLKNRESGTERQTLGQLEKAVSLPHVVVISGVRRCGKSTLLVQLMRKFYPDQDFYYFNFEDERLVNFKVQDFNTLYETLIELYGERRIFFFDEIQNIDQWERFVRRMLDKQFKFFITGSNASLLSRELGTKLTARYIPIELFPFSFSEYLSFQEISFSKRSLSITHERAMIKKHFNDYLSHGGMPEFLKYKSKELLKMTYDDILYRDIVVRHELHDAKALRELSSFCLANVGNLISFNKLKTFLSLGSVNTVKSYLEFLENAYLIFTRNKFSYSIKQQLIAPKKVYAVDMGFLFFASFSEDIGRRLENIVFIELLRQKYMLYYYKTKNGKEIDFAIREENKISTLIQVTAHLQSEELLARECDALWEALDELKLSHGLILTLDEDRKLEKGRKTILVKPVYQWLLK